MSTSIVLNKAKTRIKHGGLAKGTFKDCTQGIEDAYCIVGAIHLVCCGSDHIDPLPLDEHPPAVRRAVLEMAITAGRVPDSDAAYQTYCENDEQYVFVAEDVFEWNDSWDNLSQIEATERMVDWIDETIERLEAS